MHCNIYRFSQGCFAILIIMVACLFTDAATIDDPTLSVYYSFDDEDQTVKDGSPHGNDGTVVGNAKWRDGVIDKAISLEPNVWVDMNGPEFKNIPVDAITMAFWVNHTGVVTDQSVFDAIGDVVGSGLFHVEIEVEGIRWTGRDVGGSNVFQIRPGPIITANEWVHFAGTYDSESREVKTFLNGVEDKTAQGAGKLSDNWNRKAGIGHHNNSRWFTGLLDEFYIFSRALSEDEINQLKDGKFLSVDPSDKLTTTWGDIKSYR